MSINSALGRCFLLSQYLWLQIYIQLYGSGLIVSGYTKFYESGSSKKNHIDFKIYFKILKNLQVSLKMVLKKYIFLPKDSICFSVFHSIFYFWIRIRNSDPHHGIYYMRRPQRIQKQEPTCSVDPVSREAKL